ncbi:bifunctional IPC transferase and DIPP synthase [Lachnospiraceae bacterium]|nr:bifunctional IPC transferase and DIPP synthase [Lachnospiraceae bacterium]
MSKNAIIMAAGMSTRFTPISLEVPKALLRVKGEVLIERQIEQLREAGVKEIVIVIGYMKEKFSYLQKKYGVVLVENPVYQTRNNHSTLYAAREYLGETFICSGDNYFVENVFLEKSSVSYYSAVFEEGDTKEWCLSVDCDGKIREVVIGGKDAWIMKGHAYFTKDFSEKFLPYLENAYMDMESKDKFWEDIYREHIDELDMYIHKYRSGIVEEFDCIEELREFDSWYRKNSGSKILQKLSKLLGSEEDELEKFQPMLKCGVLKGCIFQHRNQSYSFDFETECLKIREA